MALSTEHVPDWRDEMSWSRYPFEDSAAMRASDSSGATFPNGLIVDASLYPTFDPVGLYRVTVTVDGRVSLTFASETAAAFCRADLTPGQTVADVFEGDRVAGVLVLGENWEALAVWQPGNYRFDQRRNRLVLSAVQSVGADGLEGITDNVLTAAGELWLIGENGVAVRPVSENEVRVDVIGDPLSRRRKCEPADAFVTPNFVKTINNEPPDDYGGFLVTTDGGQSVLRIFPDGTGLRITVVGRKQ